MEGKRNESLQIYQTILIRRPNENNDDFRRRFMRRIFPLDNYPKIILVITFPDDPSINIHLPIITSYYNKSCFYVFGIKSNNWNINDSIKFDELPRWKNIEENLCVVASLINFKGNQDIVICMYGPAVWDNNFYYDVNKFCFDFNSQENHLEHIYNYIGDMIKHYPVMSVLHIPTDTTINIIIHSPQVINTSYILIDSSHNTNHYMPLLNPSIINPLNLWKSNDLFNTLGSNYLHLFEGEPTLIITKLSKDK